ncbi:hypothetical protein ANCCAN_19052 [Ancylostoma caninum]|uniref:SCP domain-containing protein n=1 Tax=Ancylostoma caninum TaxID=29170 RepID=A0A368FWD1_ANCCA|nr:hypothetical protein ANCCAN_19052 [Ancylostoma caninum]
MGILPQFQVWDCNLEKIGYDELSKCKPLPDSGIVIDKVGRDFRDGILSTKKNFDLKTETSKLLNAWYDEVKQNDIPDNLSYKPAYHNFSAIVRDNAKGIGCTYTTACPGGTKFVCVYDARKNNPTGKLYIKGPTCEKCGSDTCTRFLCEPKGYTPVIVPVKCPDDGMTENMQTTAQNMHNYYRRLIATGWARNKQTVYAPIAAKMLAVTYDCTGLGKEAKDKSSDCRSDIGTPTSGRAMNKLEIKNYTMPLQDALELNVCALTASHGT